MIFRLKPVELASRQSSPMAPLLRRSLFVLLILVAVWFTWALASIPLRLSRNGKIVQRLVQSLEVRFPGVGFRGAASYEKEVIYISVVNRLDEADRQEVEGWLRERKIEQQIAPEIWLRFEAVSYNEHLIIRSGTQKRLFERGIPRGRVVYLLYERDQVVQTTWRTVVRSWDAGAA